MIFDRLCGIAERHLPELRSIIEKTRIFYFDGIAHEVLKDSYKNKTDDEMIEIMETFFLPFPNIAIEDRASCIIILDTNSNQVGLSNKRLWVEALPFNTKPEGFNYNVNWSENQKKDIARLQLEKQIIISFGHCFGKDINQDSMKIAGAIDMMFCGTKEKLSNYTYGLSNKENFAFANKHSIQNVITAFHQVIYFNQPDRFILRESPVKYVKPKNDRLLRTHQRPKYTMLYPDAIRRKLGFRTIDSHVTRIAHERRQHWRYLTADRYKYDMDGNEIEPKVIPAGPRRGEFYYKKMIVPATWIGPSEAVINNKLYKVMLDR